MAQKETAKQEEKEAEKSFLSCLNGQYPYRADA